MKEALYKIILLIIFSLSFADNENFYTYDFVNIDIIPLQKSKNNVGIRLSAVEDRERIFFQMQNWLADNLYVHGSISPSSNERVNIIYNVNFGYDKKNDIQKLKNTIFDFGYYYKRLETEQSMEYKWTSMSLIFNSIFKDYNFLLALTYISNNDSSNKLAEFFGTLDFLNTINDSLILKYGFKIYKEDKLKLSPFITLKYIL